MWTSGYTCHTQTQGGGWDGTRLCAWLICSWHFSPCHKTCRWSWAELGQFSTSLLRCSDALVCFLNPLLYLNLFWQISQLKSASSLAPLLFTPLAQEGICLARFRLPLNSSWQIVQANMMSLCIWLACTFSFILLLNDFPHWLQIACTLCGPSETGWSSSICYRFCSYGLGSSTSPISTTLSSTAVPTLQKEYRYLCKILCKQKLTATGTVWKLSPFKKTKKERKMAVLVVKGAQLTNSALGTRT